MADPLALKLSKRGAPPGQAFQMNLDRVADYCSRVPKGCDAEITDFIGKMVPVVQAQDWSPTTTALRAVVRPEIYITQMTSALHGETLISTPFAGNLVMICYFDAPTAMRPAVSKDLTTLGLAREPVIQTCLKNMRTALPRLPDKPPAQFSSGQALGYLQGDPYESSYLLLHDDWAPLARSLGGRLIVAAPGADLILYGQDTGPASVDALTTLARDMYGKVDRPISTTVFRWTPSGWDVIAP